MRRTGSPSGCASTAKHKGGKKVEGGRDSAVFFQWAHVRKDGRQDATKGKLLGATRRRRKQIGAPAEDPSPTIAGEEMGGGGENTSSARAIRRHVCEKSEQSH